MWSLVLALSIGQPLPDVAVKDARGTPVKLRTLAPNDRPLLVNFWATWCGPCRDELPVLLRAHRAGRVRLVALNVGETPATVARFLKREGLSGVPVYFAPASVANRFALPGLPGSFFADKSGRLAARVFGPLTDDRLDSALRSGSRLAP